MTINLFKMKESYSKVNGLKLLAHLIDQWPINVSIKNNK
jgi:hypothetical protein